MQTSRHSGQLSRGHLLDRTPGTSVASWIADALSKDGHRDVIYCVSGAVREDRLPLQVAGYDQWLSSGQDIAGCTDKLETNKTSYNQCEIVGHLPRLSYYLFFYKTTKLLFSNCATAADKLLKSVKSNPTASSSISVESLLQIWTELPYEIYPDK